MKKMTYSQMELARLVAVKRMETKLYYHRTDGGAEYLCTKKVQGTKNEGDMQFAAVRLDGGAVLMNPFATATELLKTAKDFVKHLSSIENGKWLNNRPGELLIRAITKAEGNPCE